MDSTNIASNPLHNVWISASAGSGKTKLLTDRVLRLLISGVEPAKILCLTYTKAAAAEMMYRITGELSKWIVFDHSTLKNELAFLTGTIPDDKVIALARTILIRMLDSKNSIKVQTIHSYCQAVVNKFPIEAGISLQAEILDEQQKQLLLTQTTHHILSDHDSNEYDVVNLRPILNNIHELSFLTLVENALQYKKKLGSIIQANSDISEHIFNRLKIDRHLSHEKLFKEFVINFDKVFELYKNDINAVLLEQDIDFLYLLIAFASANIDAKQKLYSKLYDAFYTTTHTARKSLIGSKFIKHYNLVNFLVELRLVMGQYVETSNSYKIAQYTASFVYLVRLVEKYYTSLKQNNAQLDYDDLINITLELFGSNQLLPWIMFKLDAQVEHVLIDESQDISLEQWQIITTLTDNFFYDLGKNDLPRTIFIVGDQKQSIFSFQGADPKLFNQVKNQYQHFINECASKLHLIELIKSYRSGEAILRVVDATFNYLNQNDSGAFIDVKSKHIPHKTHINSKVELWMPVLGKQAKPKKDFSWDIRTERKEIYDSAKILAKVIANEVQNYLANNQTLKPGDIMILIRKRDRFAEHLVRALKDNDIAVNGLDRIKLNDNIVIKDLLALANFILLPHDDYNLAVLLKSPIITLEEEQLFTLSQRINDSLWDRLRFLSADDQKLLLVYDFLNYFLKEEALQHCVPIYSLYTCLLDIKGVRKNFISRFGLQINEIIDEFLNVCLQFESQNGSSLQRFVSWFVSSNIEIKREINNRINDIRIMTVHAAKGLQAKMVILADSLSLPRVSKHVIWSEELDLPLYNGGTKNNNAIYRKTLQQVEMQGMQEYYRLLYVAMTRAEERLVVCGWSSDSSVHKKSWYNTVRFAMEKIGYSMVCKNLGGYSVVTDGNSVSDAYFYSDSTNKVIVEKIVDSYAPEKNAFEESKVVYDLPDFIWQKPKITTDNYCSPSTLIAHKVAYSPLDKVVNVHLGLLIHKILEISMKNKKTISVAQLIKKYAQEYHLKISDKIISNMETLIGELKASLSANVRMLPGASIACKVNSLSVHSVIDLLIVTDNEVKIIDYKAVSFVDITLIPQQYIAQLATYKNLLSRLYIDKKIKCYIVSIVDGKFFEPSNKELEAYTLC